ncbi:MAG: TIR domain-containing protein [Alphaproteobacteria bacterium]|nr:TIR domain-containing protein [Alphaproteobacteria bacterium]
MSPRKQIQDLIKQGRAILRTPRPAERQRKWRHWAERVGPAVQEISEGHRRRLELEFEDLVNDIKVLVELEDTLLHPVAEAHKPPVSPLATPSQDNAATAPPETPQHGEQVKVFLSYLTEDVKIAEVLKRELHALSERIVVFAAFDALRAGDDWKRQLGEEIEDADWFALIYTDPRKNWDWPIHEATTFEASKNRTDEHDRRLCCLHDTEDRPSPLSQYQSHKVDLFVADLVDDEDATRLKKTEFYKNSRLYSFLTELCQWPAANPIKTDLARSQDQLLAACDNVAEAFNNNRSDAIRDENYYPPRMELVVRPICDDATSAEVVRDGKVKFGPIAERLFGIRRPENMEIRWHEFKNTFTRLNEGILPPWFLQLEEAIIDALNGIEPRPIRFLMYSEFTNNFYRPIVTRQKYYLSGRRKIHIIFSVQSTLDFLAHEEHGIILATLIFGSRFRFEILEPFIKKLDKMAEEVELIDMVLDVKTQLEIIESDAAQHGLTDPKAVARVFRGRAKSAIESLFDEWQTIRHEIFEITNKSNEVDFDPAEARKVLLKIFKQSLIPLNNKFMDLASTRYRGLVEARFLK